MNYNSDNKTMNAAFENMKLEERPANEGPAYDSVMERKYALCFKLRISINEGEFVLSLWAISMPVVVIVHGNQELKAWATIYWDNSISRYNNGLIDQDIQNPFITLHENAKNLLTNLITSSFIIEKHPPQVLKLKTKFQSSVRLLFGNVLPFKPEKKENVVTVLFVNELQAQEIQRTRIVCSRRILTNDLKLMEYNSDNKTMNAAFKKMILKRRPANEGPAHDSVMDRKYALCFKLKISLGEGEGEFVISLWTISIPVVVVSHGNQKLQAWATIFWDSSISRYNNGLLDQVNVPWDNLSRVLSIKFSSSMGFDGHFLTEDNIAFLKFKLFGGHFLNNDLSITWNEFRNGSMISNPELSFWNWFYMAMKLTQDHLRALWGDRRIIGFIDKTTAENYLLNQACDQGTFIIRFPDSKAGAISIAWKSSSTTVTHVFPLVSKDLEVRSLADCIMDCQELTKFYPNIGKLEALRNYISPPIVVPVGMNYVSRNIRAAIA
ncbi:unnamed protein product [Diamesa tonsa]